MNKQGYFGEFGGCYVPETLMAPLAQLALSYEEIKNDESFQNQLSEYLKHYVGRPTPLYYAKRLTNYLGGAQIYLKREDLAHTGAHKINNSLGQAFLAKQMGKQRLIAETGAGQHGVATATVASLLGMSCTVYMGAVDMARQFLNVQRMKMLGAEVKAVEVGTRTLKDAVSEALRDWVVNLKNSHYILGSALGPHPYPTIVRDFQKVIGLEARQQIKDACGTLPTELVACVGGGSNAIGLFYPFLADNVQMTGVEAGGTGLQVGHHAARFATGKMGVFHGTKTILLQDDMGQILPTHSVSAGLDYAGVGPEHAFLQQTRRVHYCYATDEEALQASVLLARQEGILPALESSHALAYVIKRAPQLDQKQIILVGLSGRGDKDMNTYSEKLGAVYA